MKNIVTAVLLSIVAAFSAATWLSSSDNSTLPAKASNNNESELPVDERVSALEQAVRQEQYARQLLQEEVMILTEELDELRGGIAPTPVTDTASDTRSDRESEASREDRRSRYARRRSPEGRIERLVEAGIDVGLADWIIQREEELQMESLQARFEAGRNGEPNDFYREQFSTREVLRQELGDDNYERYLTANGRPISVAISSVIGSSPAQAAGLQSGDEIMRYDGERVFSMTDINNATMAGEAGQNVVIDIVRDGLPMQVAMPRGPIGITGGRRSRQ